MYTEIEKEYLLKAVTAFKGRFNVISPDYKVLATNRPAGDSSLPADPDQTCFERYYQRNSPCQQCPVGTVLKTGEPVFITNPHDPSYDSGEIPCRYLYPIYAGEKIEALASLDF